MFTVSIRDGPENWKTFNKVRNLVRPNVFLSYGLGASKMLKCGVTQEGSMDPMAPAPTSTA